MNESKIRWGILGCGRIARKFTADLRLVADAELVAIASRNRETLELFAKDFPVSIFITVTKLLPPTRK